MADEVDESEAAEAPNAVGGINAITKLVAAIAGLVTAGSAIYVAVPKKPEPPPAHSSTAQPPAAEPPLAQPPTRSYIQLASFGSEEAAVAAARKQARDLLRQVCVYDSRGVFASAIGPMLTTDAQDMVGAIREHPTVHAGALVLPGKTYVSLGKCFTASN